MMYILPLTVIEALQLQKRDVFLKETSSITPRMTTDELYRMETAVDESCKAIEFLSRAYRLCQRYSLTLAQIDEIERYIVKANTCSYVWM